MSSNARLDDEPDRLESWKEIAAFIGRDERTAMRWAAHGMPVHRVPGGKRGRVFASRKEISRWLGRRFEVPSHGSSETTPLRRLSIFIIGAVVLPALAPPERNGGTHLLMSRRVKAGLCAAVPLRSGCAHLRVVA